MANEIKIAKSWKGLFAPHILDRGYGYYQEGRVWEIEWQKNRITALVSGSDEYHVMIQLNEESSKIEMMRCDCPYAADGSHCKHEAAVLYQLNVEENEDYDEGVQSLTTDWMKNWQGNSEGMKRRREECEREKSELRKTIDSIPEDEVREILYKQAQQDSMLRNRLLTTYREGIDDWQLQNLIDTIRSLKYKFGDRGGFVDWENASSYMSSLERILYDNVQPLIDRNQFEPAFALTCEVFLTINDTEMDDDGQISMGVTTCREFWEMITEKASDEFQRTMYEWFRDHIGSDSVNDYMEEELEEFLMEGFHSEELLQLRLGDLDIMIQKDEEELRREPERNWSTYSLEHHVLNRIETMKELELSQNEILMYCQKFDCLPEVLLRHAEEILESRNAEEAIELLQTGKNRDGESIRAVTDYSRKLIEIYRESGDKQRLVAELLFQTTTCHQSDLEYVEELKNTVELESWPAFRKQILSADACKGIKRDILAEEGMLAELMQEIAESDSIYTLDKYEKVLRPQFSDQIRDLYADYVRKAVEHVSDRKQYRNLTKDLKKLTRYRGGREIAREIAAQWKKTYARRPAFMDELKMAGF